MEIAQKKINRFVVAILGAVFAVLVSVAGIAPVFAAATIPAAGGVTELFRFPYLQASSPTSMKVLWGTLTDGVGQIRYRLASGATWTTVTSTEQTFTTATTGLSSNFIQHEAVLTGLVPGTEYIYDVILDGVTLASDIPFTTLNESTSAVTSFVVMADFGTSYSTPRAVRDRIASRDVNGDFVYPHDFIIGAGDLAYNNGTYQEYNQNFFGQMSGKYNGSNMTGTGENGILASAPYLPALGNHDYAQSVTNTPSAYVDSFSLPVPAGIPAQDNERYYSLDDGAAHIVSIDAMKFEGDMTANRTSEMLAWLDADLAATTKPWKIITLHQAIFSVGPHGTWGDMQSNGRMRSLLAPILQNRGVQLVMFGHDHIYQRSKRIRVDSNGKIVRNGDCSVAESNSGVVYVGVGNGGDDLHGRSVNPDACGTAGYTSAVNSYGDGYDFVALQGNGDPVIYDSISTPQAPLTPTIRHGFTQVSINGDTATITAYNYNGETLDQFTMVSGASVSDTTDPSVPTGLSASAISSSRIDLSWTASTDDTAVTGYRIYRDGTLLTTSATTSYSDTGLSAATAYAYTVAAYDAAGNVSSQSSSASATTSAVALSTKFSLNDRVQVSSGTLGAYASPDTTLLGSHATGSLGTVIGGPIIASGTNWWNINYDSGSDGWSAEDTLSAYADPATGTVYYVATTGNDSNAGTSVGAPFRTVAHAVGVVGPGDTIEIRAGTYTESFLITTPGTSSAWITMRPYNSESVLIRSTGVGPTIYFYHDTCDEAANTYPCQSMYWTIQGLSIQGSPNGGADGNAVKIDTPNVKLLNNTISCAVADIVKLVRTSDDVDIMYNEIFQDSGVVTPSANAQGIDIVGADRTRVAFNYVHDVPDIGMYAKGNARNTVFEGNHLDTIGSNAIMLGQSTDAARLIDGNYESYDGIIRNNVISNVEWACLATASSYNVKMYNNSCYNTGTTVHGSILISNESEIAQPGNGIEIRNNIIYGSASNPIFKLSNYMGAPLSDNSTLYVDHNIYWVNGGVPTFTWNGEFDTVGVSTWRTSYASLTGHTDTSVVINPAYIGAPTDLSIGASSPAVDAGVTTASVTTDYLSLARPQGSAYDIGAYEYFSGAADTTAPTVTNVTSDTVNGSYNAGDVIDIDVTFSEAVTSTGSVTVTLETGTTDRTCTFTVSSSTTGTCNYTVQAGDTSSDLTVNSIAGTVADASSNPMTTPATPTTNLAANKALVIDTTDPSGSITAPTAGATVSGTTSITASASDTGSGIASVQFKVDGTNQGTADTSSPYSIFWDTTGATNASHSLTATITDTAGNTYTTNAVSVTVDNTTPDTTAPTVTNVTSDTANGTYNAGDVIDIDVTFSEAVTSTGSVTVTLETGTTDRTCTFTVSSSTTGTCNYTVQAGDTSADLTVSSVAGVVNDAASNPMTTPATPTTNLAANKALVIDTTAPTNQNTVFASSTTKTGGATVTIVSSADATNSVWFAPSGTSTFSAGSTMTTAGGTATSILAPATAGSYKLFVIDQAGNASSASTATLTVDTATPTRSAGSPSGALVSGTTSTTISLTTDENATCQYATVSGTAYASMTNTFTTTGTTSHSTTVSGLSDGTSYTYFVRCQDTATNPNSTDYSISFSVSTTSDVTAPSVPTNLAGSAASTSAINLSWTASTDDTAVSTYEVYRNGTQITSTASTSYQDTGLAAGTSYLYSVLAKDAANNASSQTSQVSVTTSSATVSSSSGGGGGGGGSKKKKKKSISGKIITRPGERAAPWVTLTAPRVGTVLPKRFTVSAVSSDRSGIQAMIVTVNGTRKKRANTGSVSYTLAKKSSMTVNVNAYDALGNRKTAEIRIAGGKVVGVRYW